MNMQPSPDYVSHSMVEDLNKCERYFYHSRILGDRKKNPANVQPGLVHHDVYSWHFGPARMKLSPAIDRAIEAREEHLKKAGVNLEGLRSEIITRVEEMTPWVTNAEVFSSEWYFENLKNLPYRGYIDVKASRTPRMDEKGLTVVNWIDEPCVWDYKVTSGKRTRSQRDADTSPQLALYALVSDVRHAGFVEIHRDTSKPIKRRFTSYTDAERARWWQWLFSQAEALKLRWEEETWAYDPSPNRWRQTMPGNPLCSLMWCEHWSKCYGCDTKPPNES